MKVDDNCLPLLFQDHLFYLEKPVDEEDAKEVQNQTSKADIKEEEAEQTMVNEAAPSYQLTKSTLVLLEKEPNEEERALLSKILSAIAVEMQACEIIMEHPEKISALQNIKLMLSFHPAYNANNNYTINDINGIKLIYADTLAVLSGSTEKKKLLWNTLKGL